MHGWYCLFHRSLLSSFIIGLVLAASAFAQQAAERPKREFRGVWIATVTNLDWPSSRNLTPQQQRNELVGLLDSLVATGFNAVVFQVRDECDALYDSPYDPWSYWLTGSQGTAPNPYYDPLEFAVAEAHKRGMEIHAWFNPFRAYRENDTYPTAANHVTKLHSSDGWIITCPDGYKLLDPGRPDVRDYIATVFTDVVRRYQIDGVHMDDYFYPYSEHGFTNEDAATFAAYNRGYPDSLKADWRRGNVNLLIEQVYDSVQALKPWVKVGISPFGIWKSGVPAGIFGMSAYDAIYCDAIAWLEGGFIDYLTPQLYWPFGGGQDYGKLQPWWADSVAANGRQLYTGNATYSQSASEIDHQIEFNRANPKVQGSVQFRANNIRYNTNGTKDLLKAKTFRTGAVIPVMGWKETTPPNSPSNLQAQLNGSTGKYELTWDAPTAAIDGDTAARYLVYRFLIPAPAAGEYGRGNNILQVAGERLVVPPARIDSPGVQYSFAVSALDKNNNESGTTSLVTLPVSAVAAATPVFPSDGEQNLSKTDGLAWSRSANAEGYRVQVASSNAFEDTAIVLDADRPDTTSTLPALLPQATYYWRVLAGNQGGSSAFSPVFSFRTGWPNPPVAVGPSGNNIPRDPRFVWSPRGGTSFRVRVVDYSTQVTLIDTTLADTTFVTPSPFDAIKIFQWYVQALSPYGNSDWTTETRFRTSSITFANREGGVPEVFELEQNYPNPFNSVTRIPFALPAWGRATVRVYDLLGREVAVLVDDVLPAGRYTATFDAGQLASGTYIYVLTSGGQRITRKLLLIK